MNRADVALERLIGEITREIARTQDARLVELQRHAIALRSAEMVETMERAQGLRRLRDHILDGLTPHG